MSHADVQSIFTTALVEATDQSSVYEPLRGIRVAYDNVVFTPETDETYLHIHLIPADVLSETLSGDHRGYIGIIQINVFTGSGTATSKSDNIIRALSKLFMLYKPFTNDDNSFMVQPITPVQVPRGVAQDSWWKVPCWFQYRADIESEIYYKEP